MAIAYQVEEFTRVQMLSESGLKAIPARYVSRRPVPADDNIETVQNVFTPRCLPFKAYGDIPILRMTDFETRRGQFLQELRHACQTWGCFQLLDHGLPLSLLQRLHAVQREFFKLPVSDKLAYANSPPLNYEGYGSVLGNPSDTGRALDWRDYFYVTLLPMSQRNVAKWPAHPPQWRTTVEEYYRHVSRLSLTLLRALSASLNLASPNALINAFIGCESAWKEHDLYELEEKLDIGFGVNYYPACPEPNLTLGLSPHSDPGGITFLLQDDNVSGLQVLAPHAIGADWLLVKPIRGALFVTVGDQLQILTNGLYKSVEHRVLVNNKYSRISIGCFLNPNNDTLVAPLPELLHKDLPALYNPITFKEYRTLIRMKGTNGKKYLQYISLSR